MQSLFNPFVPLSLFHLYTLSTPCPNRAIRPDLLDASRDSQRYRRYLARWTATSSLGADGDISHGGTNVCPCTRDVDSIQHARLQHRRISIAADSINHNPSMAGINGHASRHLATMASSTTRRTAGAQPGHGAHPPRSCTRPLQARAHSRHAAHRRPPERLQSRSSGGRRMRQDAGERCP